MSLKVLVVDDSMFMRRSIKNMIESLGYFVVGEAKTGEEAVALCRSLSPELVTMDIEMPDMNGIEAVRKLRLVKRSVKIIMITSSGREEIVMKAIRSGANSYILKPLKIEALEDKIRKIFPEITSKEVEQSPQTMKMTESIEDIDLIKLD